MKTPSLTVAIYARNPGSYLTAVAQNIRNSPAAAAVPFLLVCDGKPISPSLKKELKALKVKIVELPGNNSPIDKVSHIMRLCKTELVLLTQDDLLYEPDGIVKIVKAFNDKDVSMVTVKIMSQLSGGFFESVLNVGTVVARYVAENWSKSNYLLSNRILAFRVSVFENFRVPDKVLGMDAYFYLENKLKGGKFVYLPDVTVYTKLSQHLAEYKKQASRFLKTSDELKEHFDPKLVDKEYTIPKGVYIKAALITFLKQPVYFVFYIALQVYMRFHKDMSALATAWEVDASTKGIAITK